MANTETTPTLKLKGKSGKEYTFGVYPVTVNFKKLGGVYLFTKYNSENNKHSLIYLGITQDLSERFDNHHKMDCIKKNGATHLCAFVLKDEKERAEAEKDILSAYPMTCNDKMN